MENENKIKLIQTAIAYLERDISIMEDKFRVAINDGTVVISDQDRVAIKHFFLKLHNERLSQLCIKLRELTGEWEQVFVPKTVDGKLGIW